jgi:5-methylcytosine-specific restriction endonuclease McrA
MKNLALLLLFPLLVIAQPLVDSRCCVTPKRDKNGQIMRRADVLREFQKLYPCPSTGLQTGSCPDWQKNHAIPLACGGKDEVSNLFWVHINIKTCKDFWCIDRYERKVYAPLTPIDGVIACKNELIK